VYRRRVLEIKRRQRRQWSRSKTIIAVMTRVDGNNTFNDVFVEQMNKNHSTTLRYVHLAELRLRKCTGQFGY